VFLGTPVVPSGDIFRGNEQVSTSPSWQLCHVSQSYVFRKIKNTGYQLRAENESYLSHCQERLDHFTKTNKHGYMDEMIETYRGFCSAAESSTAGGVEVEGLDGYLEWQSPLISLFGDGEAELYSNQSGQKVPRDSIQESYVVRDAGNPYKPEDGVRFVIYTAPNGKKLFEVFDTLV
jgi:hypothetical protein